MTTFTTVVASSSVGTFLDTDHRILTTPDSGWRPKRETYVTEYDRGELILDINDPKTRRRMWSGTASAQVRASDSRETQDNRIREAVRRMLAEFPPK